MRSQLVALVALSTLLLPGAGARAGSEPLKDFTVEAVGTPWAMGESLGMFGVVRVTPINGFYGPIWIETVNPPTNLQIELPTDASHPWGEPYDFPVSLGPRSASNTQDYDLQFQLSGYDENDPGTLIRHTVTGRLRVDFSEPHGGRPAIRLAPGFEHVDATPVVPLVVTWVAHDDVAGVRSRLVDLAGDPLSEWTGSSGSADILLGSRPMLLAVEMVDWIGNRNVSPARGPLAVHVLDDRKATSIGRWRRSVPNQAYAKTLSTANEGGALFFRIPVTTWQVALVSRLGPGLGVVSTVVRDVTPERYTSLESLVFRNRAVVQVRRVGRTWDRPSYVYVVKAQRGRVPIDAVLAVIDRTGCADSYPGICIPPPPPLLNCSDVPWHDFRVRPPDPHGFDGDHDGIGCETP